MTSLTVATLLDIVSRAHAAINEAEGVGDHQLIGELAGIVKLCQDVMGSSHMGCAADVAILDLDFEEPVETCPQCGTMFTEGCATCSEAMRHP